VDKGVVRISYMEGDILQTFLNKLKKQIFQRLCGFTLRAGAFLGTRMDKNGIKTTIPSASNTKGYVLGT
jgi:hypothetical protein